MHKRQAQVAEGSEVAFLLTISALILECRDYRSVYGRSGGALLLPFSYSPPYQGHALALYTHLRVLPSSYAATDCSMGIMEMVIVLKKLFRY